MSRRTGPLVIVCRQCRVEHPVASPKLQRKQKFCSQRCKCLAQRGRHRPPLYITCKRPGCGQVKEVNRPFDQRTQKYCSHLCSALVHNNIRKARLGPQRSASARRKRVLARVAGLSALEAFRLGYTTGLESKLRQVRRWYVLTKRPDAHLPTRKAS